MSAEPVRIQFRGPVARFMRDETRYIDLEGAFRSGKTTACLFKVARACVAYPGMPWLICRWTDSDTHGILKPVWRKCLTMMGIGAEWDPSEHCDIFPNGPDPDQPHRGGSRVYIRGLKPQTELSRYAKLRGLTLAGVYNDQTEELPYDFYLELKGRLSAPGYPHQLILSPNPEFSEDHYLAKEFPIAQTNKNHHYYCVSIYDNAHNLDATVIPDLVTAYPPGSAKHRPAILGQRGVKVLGTPVYAGYFSRRIHEQSAAMNPELPLIESIDFGQHHPCVVWAQYDYHGGLHVLGAVMGLDLYLDDFAEVILRYRNEWFGGSSRIDSCCDPAGAHKSSQGARQTGVGILNDHGIYPMSQPDSNMPLIRSTAVERVGAAMRRRSPSGGEGFTVDPVRQVIVTATGIRSSKFMTDGLEAGYVWDPHPRSVGNKMVRVPLKDGWYEHGQNCLEYIELNFGGATRTAAQVARDTARAARVALQQAQRDHDPADRQVQTRIRGGYR